MTTQRRVLSQTPIQSLWSSTLGAGLASAPVAPIEKRIARAALRMAPLIARALSRRQGGQVQPSRLRRLAQEAHDPLLPGEGGGARLLLHRRLQGDQGLAQLGVGAVEGGEGQVR